MMPNTGLANLQKKATRAPERRGSRRVRGFFPAVWELPERTDEGHVRDISPGGCFAQTQGKVGVGSPVRLAVELPWGEWVKLLGVVAHRSRSGFGVRFSRLGVEEATLLEALATGARARTPARGDAVPPDDQRQGGDDGERQQTGEGVDELRYVTPDGFRCTARLAVCPAEGASDGRGGVRWVLSCARHPQEWAGYEGGDGRLWWTRVRDRYDPSKDLIEYGLEHRGAGAAEYMTYKGWDGRLYRADVRPRMPGVQPVFSVRAL